jgi:ribonucleoside-diphosphate reductase alpha chain
MRMEKMFTHRGKLAERLGDTFISAYKRTYSVLYDKFQQGLLPKSENYLANNELAENIYRNKYYLKDMDQKALEESPEEVFLRIASFVAVQEKDKEMQDQWAETFYKHLYEGYWIPGGRVLAGAGDLYRLKTLANCFVTEVEEDNIESIYTAAAECARTYSYGGGIGVDISPLRPKDSIVHNAADSSTGAVSFMELYSQTTGLIGQSGRRGALMLTIDVKHPDIFNFISIKKNPNWVSQQIVQQCEWSGKFSKEQLKEVKKQVVENTQVRFANISVKVSDEFMQAVQEESRLGRNKILVYYKKTKKRLMKAYQDEGHYYSLGIPAKHLAHYDHIQTFDNYSQLSAWLTSEYGITLSEADLRNSFLRDVYGDYLCDIPDNNGELAIRSSGDYLLYFASKPTGEIRNLIKARDLWNSLVESNYRTAEPGLIFWTKMSDYSPSNYVNRPIISTNPCAEVPLEAGGACNLGSINLSRFITNPFSKDAAVDWNAIHQSVQTLVRFLDNVVSWNEILNPLAKQQQAASETRRLGLGIMGIADMLLQLSVGYDSQEGVRLMQKIMHYITNSAYQASALIAGEKKASPIFNYEQYARGPFFKEALTQETKGLIKKNGLRNIAITSIAPTGSISNIIKGFEYNNRNYIGVSGGIEPIYSLFYNRRSESFGNKIFKVFHAMVQAYIDSKEMQKEAENARSENDLKSILPETFFRTAHAIQFEDRLKIQSVCQKYIDHSISSTINLPETVEPEEISEIYIRAWQYGLKGITIYRDGSRYPILSTDAEKSDFSKFKEKVFKIQTDDGEVLEFSGDEVLRLPNGHLTTPYHYINKLKTTNVQKVVR